MNLVLCCDGTWATADALYPTNVALTARVIREAGCPDTKVWYDPGVGTGDFDRIRGGLFGHGLQENVEQGFAWLAEHWSPGDRIFLFGFSRGAYTARSIAGLLERRRLPRCQIGDSVLEHPVPIRFLGVWDTVGALGVPGLTGRLRSRWHDVRLHYWVQNAVQHLAVDEQRRPFSPSLWQNVPYQRNVKQVWYPGVHSDIGGGRRDRTIAKLTLHAMIYEAFRAGLGDGRILDKLEQIDGPRDLLLTDWKLPPRCPGAYRLLGRHRRRPGLAVKEQVAVAYRMFRRHGYEPPHAAEFDALGGGTP